MNNLIERLRRQHKEGIMNLPEDWEYVHYGDAADAIEAQEDRMAEALHLLQDVADGVIQAEGTDYDGFIEMDIVRDIVSFLTLSKAPSIK